MELRLLPLVAVASFACATRAPEARDVKYLSVFVSKDGQIAADGQQVSLSRLEDELDKAKTANAVVLFAREPSERGRAGDAMLGSR